ncbi:hypothetical protein [Microtetraspora niveoalba]|uniref:hypothetical protein n=1 Tax=Microtetraspora niveoalba TaxID=46175 RepID=UPI000836FE53|nr:hypothetical protein [Microtetraspora niveoalba]
MNFCLSDLVPPLRWSDAARIGSLTAPLRPGDDLSPEARPEARPNAAVGALPPAWWRSLPVSRVLAVLGPEALGELVTELALEQWPAAAVGDVLPALHVLDPDDADDPQVAIALDRAGSWPGLLSLSARELSDQPFIRARPVLTALFTAVFTRLAPAGAVPPAAGRTAVPEAVRESPAALPEGASAVLAPVAGSAAASPVAAPSEDLAAPELVPSPTAPGLGEAPEAVAVAVASPESVADMPGSPDGPEGQKGPDVAPEPQSLDVRDASVLAEGPAFPAPAESLDAEAPEDTPGMGENPRAAEHTNTPDAAGSPDAGENPDAEAHAAEPDASENSLEDTPDAAPSPHGTAADDEPDAVPSLDAEALGDTPNSAPSPGATSHDEPDADANPDAKAHATEPDASENSLEDTPDAAPSPHGTAADDEPDAVPSLDAEALGDTPDSAPSPGTTSHDEPDADANPGAEAHAAEPDASENPDAAVLGDGPDADAGGSPDDSSGKAPAEDVDFPALLDAVFAGLDDESWMVAQNRVFADTPTAPEALAKLLAIPVAAIGAIEETLRERLAGWLAGPDAVPYGEHVKRVAETLGVAAPTSRLIDAAPWHRAHLPSLDVPAWQFVLATLPDHRVSGSWVVAGELSELHERTRALILGAERPPTIARALELVASLGIHPEVAKEWLENVPQLRMQSGNGSRPAPAPVGQPAPAPVPAPGTPPVPPAQPAPVPPGQAVPPTPHAPVAPSVPPVPVGQAVPPVPPGAPQSAPAPDFSPGPAPGFPPAAPAMQQGQLKDVALTRRCFRQPDGRWWLRVDVTAQHLEGAEISLPSGFAAYLGLSPGGSRTVRSATGDVTFSWQAHPALGSLQSILTEMAAKEGSHIFLTLSDEGMLRVRHLPAASGGDSTARALRLVGYTAPGGTREQAYRVIATRIGLAGPVAEPELLTRLRERGDRDLLSLLG